MMIMNLDEVVGEEMHHPPRKSRNLLYLNKETETGV
jgi:hypothetical protein